MGRTGGARWCAGRAPFPRLHRLPLSRFPLFPREPLLAAAAAPTAPPTAPAPPGSTPPPPRLAPPTPADGALTLRERAAAAALAACRGSLEPHGVPRVLDIVKRIATTPAGKIPRRPSPAVPPASPA